MITVFVASSARFSHVEWMTPFSIKENTSDLVEIHIITPGDGVPETGCTGFTNLRYLVPKLCRDMGRTHGIYLDVDMLVLGDIADLWEYRHAGDWATLLDGSDEVSIFSSVCQFPDIATHNKTQLRGAQQRTPAIPMEWNSEDGVISGAKLLHFTDLNTQPWDTEHPNINARLHYEAYRARYLARNGA